MDKMKEKEPYEAPEVIDIKPVSVACHGDGSNYGEPDNEFPD